jgi:predicted DNA-binding transcriptional regulator AlpA
MPKMEENLIVTLKTSDLRSLISELLDEKLFLLKAEKQESKKEASLISRLEVAKLFGVSKTTIDKWRRSKILPPIVKIASRVYFRRDQIIDLLQRKQRIIDSFNLKSHDHE